MFYFHSHKERNAAKVTNTVYLSKQHGYCFYPTVQNYLFIALAGRKAYVQINTQIHPEGRREASAARFLPYFIAVSKKIHIFTPQHYFEAP